MNKLTGRARGTWVAVLLMLGTGCPLDGQILGDPNDEPKRDAGAADHLPGSHPDSPSAADLDAGMPSGQQPNGGDPNPMGFDSGAGPVDPSDNAANDCVALLNDITSAFPQAGELG